MEDTSARSTAAGISPAIKAVGLFAAVVTGGLLLYFLHQEPSLPRVDARVATIDPSKIDLVPDEKAAVAIAVAVLSPVYGDALIKFEHPFHGRLDGEVWHVEGSLPRGLLGGVAHIDISKADARVGNIYHTK